MIIGLGWLGQDLHDELKASGLEVMGTHSTQCNLLRDELPPRACDVLFLNTPPLVEIAPEMYALKVSKSTASRIIFISSTSVYGMGQGEVNEDSFPVPDSPGGKWLLSVENELRKRIGSRLLVIRPGGLIGGQRHPVFHLQGRSGVSGGNERVNLIHREDLIAIIRKTPSEVSVVNAISPVHPLKSDYYIGWAQKLGLVPPTFKESVHSARVIHSKVLATFYSDWRCRELDWI
jgi:hypothetical protein